MAKGKKTGGRNFKKGQSGNPNGRPKLPSDLKQIRSLVGSQFIRLFAEGLLIDLPTVESKLLSKETSCMDLLVLKFIKKAIESGDSRYFTIIFDRFVDLPEISTSPQTFPVNLHTELVKIIENAKKENMAS